MKIKVKNRSKVVPMPDKVLIVGEGPLPLCRKLSTEEEAAEYWGRGTDIYCWAMHAIKQGGCVFVASPKDEESK